MSSEQVECQETPFAKSLSFQQIIQLAAFSFHLDHGFLDRGPWLKSHDESLPGTAQSAGCAANPSQSCAVNLIGDSIPPLAHGLRELAFQLVSAYRLIGPEDGFDRSP